MRRAVSPHIATASAQLPPMNLPTASAPRFNYLAGDAACEAAGELAGAAGEVSEAAGATVADACGAGVGVASGTLDCNTEREPVIPGIESISANSINPAAAPIVIFERMLAVPRGPNAVLETLLENRSPAPDFPGCNSTTTTRTMHDRINNPYKR